jgi:phage gpG-like protein
MTTTYTILGFTALLNNVQNNMTKANASALEQAAQIIETEAKRVIGTYDYGWTPLKPATIASKATGDSPLLETGEMRDSIEHISSDKEASIGSNNDKALWHELGTVKIPARSFLVGAYQHKQAEIMQVIGDRIVGTIMGKPIP